MLMGIELTGGSGVCSPPTGETMRLRPAPLLSAKSRKNLEVQVEFRQCAWTKVLLAQL